VVVGEVLICLCDAGRVDEAAEAVLEQRLSVAERAARDEFRLPSRKREYLIGRSLTRTLIARGAGCEPGDIVIEISYGGKPYIAAPDKAARFRFSISHSEGIVGVAIADGTDIGLDVVVEKLTRSEYEGIVMRYFRPEEARWVLDGDGDSGRNRFHALFARKEAHLKRAGKGIGGLRSVEPVELSCEPFSDDRRYFAPLPRAPAEGFVAVETSSPVERWTLAIAEPPFELCDIVTVNSACVFS